MCTAVSPTLDCCLPCPLTDWVYPEGMLCWALQAALQLWLILHGRLPEHQQNFRLAERGRPNMLRDSTIEFCSIASKDDKPSLSYNMLDCGDYHHVGKFCTLPSEEFQVVLIDIDRICYTIGHRRKTSTVP
jgi:hypothetical protein